MRPPMPGASTPMPMRAVIALLLSAHAAARCTDTCATADDGSCDDGGADAHTAKCAFDTDCKDCGPRRVDTPMRRMCNDVCVYANDNSCDDGGAGSAYAECSLGADCSDCGRADRDPPAGATVGCEDSCHFASDEHCDDGGSGASYEECGMGTDCADCGARSEQAMEAFYEKYVPVIGYGAPSDEVACDDSCFAAYIGDGICDDGGPGSKTSECARGTDCADCGPSHREEAPTPPPSLPALPPGCLLHSLTNLRELEPPRSCPALNQHECARHRVNARRCTWELDSTQKAGGACRPGENIDCSLSPPPSPPVQPAYIRVVDVADGEGLCQNLCPLARNGYCDDGGPAALFVDCEYGSDCDDCGERPPALCSNTCYFHSDGTCDDGVRKNSANALKGEMTSVWDECALGCAARPPALPPALPPPLAPRR